ncbi:substrate binding domain-containing protein [Acetobacter sacchari]|uniref:Substrate binding domain-containing protein n=1 Tax=Acetobacter sacchari TaxID=2661687 RepID=A0ABS3LW37_9PROT|nr:substrate binding domain-containing protein [Acetobacter sacchari]MBO1360114.1 substrate binding domain-containing protein [Acetobacter sacchari]
MIRSTRKLSLTDEGGKLLERAQRILAEVSEAEEMLSHGRLEPQGLLRVSAPIALGRMHVSPVSRRLAAAYPSMSIDLLLTDRVTAVIDEGLDVVIRIGGPSDSGLIVRKLADSHRVVVASKDYLAARGTPTTPEALVDHDCLHQGHGAVWKLIGPDGRLAEIEARSRLRCNNGEVWRDWALAGSGIAMKSWIDVADDVRAGRLIHVLPEWKSPPAPICALLPTRTLVPTRVRVFLESMADQLRKNDSLQPLQPTGATFEAG